MQYNDVSWSVYSRRTADDVGAQGVIVSTSEEFRISAFLAIIDSLIVIDLDKLFLFLRHIDVDAEVPLNGVVDFYSKDLEEVTTVENERFQWKALLKALKVTDCSPYKMLTLMLKNNFSTSFPNIYILLRHYLTHKLYW